MANRKTIAVEAMADIIARSAANQPVLYSEMIKRRFEGQNIFKHLTGEPGSNKAVLKKRDWKKTSAQTMHFPTADALGGPEQVGEGDIEGKEENPVDRTFSVKVDLVRFSVGMSYYRSIFTTYGKEGGMTMLMAQLGDRVARYHQFRVLYHLREAALANAMTTLRPDGKAQADLEAGDTLSAGLIRKASNALAGNGARPMSITIDKHGTQIEQYLAVGTKSGLQAFVDSPQYLNAQQEAGARGEANRLFKGGYSDWNGIGILGFEPVRVLGRSPVGAPNLPIAHLGVAITAGTSKVNVVGGGKSYDSSQDPQPNYFETFDNYPLKVDNSPPSPSDDTRYAAIVNPDGTFMVFSYETNSKHQLVMIERLGASATGDQVTSLAGITWNASGKNTNAAVQGATIVPITENGIRHGGTYVLGAESSLFGIGADWNRLVSYSTNGTLDKAVQNVSVMGIGACKYTAEDFAPNAIYIEHAVDDGFLPVDFKTYNA